MRRISLAVTAAATIVLIAWANGAAAWLPADVQPLVLPMLATLIAATLLARYFDWRGNVRRRIAAERRHPAPGPSHRERESLDRAA
jgi:hypothetical protein